MYREFTERTVLNEVRYRNSVVKFVEDKIVWQEKQDKECDNEFTKRFIQYVKNMDNEEGAQKETDK